MGGDDWETTLGTLKSGVIHKNYREIFDPLGIKLGLVPYGLPLVYRLGIECLAHQGSTFL